MGRQHVHSDGATHQANPERRRDHRPVLVAIELLRTSTFDAHESQFPWPWCDRCDRWCDGYTTHRDIYSGKVIYTLTCHGRTQRQYVDGLDLHDATLIWTT